MFKQAKRFLKKEPAKPHAESASRPISPPGSRPLEHAGPSIVVPPTEAAIAAVNANKGYSGSVLASKLQDQQLTSPKIPAGSIRTTPPESSSSHGHNPSSLVAEPSNAPLHVAPQKSSPDHPHTALSPARAEVPSPSAASYHAEASGASYTSSTGSGNRPNTHSPNARNHRAAVHAANERLQKALQLGGRRQPASAVASSVAASMPLSSGSPGKVKDMPQEAHASHTQQHGQSPASAGTAKAAKGIPHMMSEASLMSAESDDDVNELTDAASEAVARTPVKVTTDRYGFLIPNEGTPGASTSASDNSPAMSKEMTRVKKWQKMLGLDGKNWNHFCAKKHAKVKQRVRKGIPDAVRGLTWQLLAGSRELVQLNPGVYEKLLAMEGGEKDNEIARDLNRTYPTHVFYQQPEGAGQKSLYHVLKTYSVYDKRVSTA